MKNYNYCCAHSCARIFPVAIWKPVRTWALRISGAGCQTIYLVVTCIARRPSQDGQVHYHTLVRITAKSVARERIHQAWKGCQYLGHAGYPEYSERRQLHRAAMLVRNGSFRGPAQVHERTSSRPNKPAVAGYAVRLPMYCVLHSQQRQVGHQVGAAPGKFWERGARFASIRPPADHASLLGLASNSRHLIGQLKNLQKWHCNI